MIALVSRQAASLPSGCLSISAAHLRQILCRRRLSLDNDSTLSAQRTPASTSTAGQLTPTTSCAMPGIPAKDATAGSSVASTSKAKYSFNTLERERRFRFPSEISHDAPELEELTAPHIQSFDALFQGATTPAGTPVPGDAGKGLLELAVKDLKSKVVFDGKGKEQGKLGNKIECECGSSLAIER